MIDRFIRFGETVISPVYLVCVVLLALIQGLSRPGMWQAYWAGDEAYFRSARSSVERVAGWAIIDQVDACVLRSPPGQLSFQLATIPAGLLLTFYAPTRLWEEGRDIPLQTLRAGSREWSLPAAWRIIEDARVKGSLTFNLAGDPVPVLAALEDADTLTTGTFSVPLTGVAEALDVYRSCLTSLSRPAAG